ncbi:MAG: 3-deoxy-7-phosphoheptulonate synthase [Francisellaceae bacterium]|jgi:3-deoxy-7-phosphoheptulonate synthase
MTIKTDELRTSMIRHIISPAQLEKNIPLPIEVIDFVSSSRQRVVNILSGKDKRLLIIIGPCSIHDAEAALDYSKQLKLLQDKYINELVLVMRVYFEPPQELTNWKGFVSDPDLDNSFEIEKGLHSARTLLLEINKLGLATGTEFFNTTTSNYFSDLISWSSVSTNTVESQIHRELASILPCPVGFENNTDGSINIAMDAIKAASNPQVLFSQNKHGQMRTIQTPGNLYPHLILKDGGELNYSTNDIKKTTEILTASDFYQKVIIDCNHLNYLKEHNSQLDIARSVSKRIKECSTNISGIILKSFLVEGKQEITATQSITYGQSITNACIDLNQADSILLMLSQTVKDKHNRREIMPNSVVHA